MKPALCVHSVPCAAIQHKHQ